MLELGEKNSSSRCCHEYTHLKQPAALYHPPASSIQNVTEEVYLLLLHTQRPPSVFLTTQGMTRIFN